MLNSIERLKLALAASELEKLKFTRVAIPDTGECIFAAKLGKIDPHEAWYAARELTDKTGRFEDEAGRALPPQAIIDASENIDVDSYLGQRASQADEYSDVEWCLEEIEAEFGRRPAPSELDGSIVYKEHAGTGINVNAHREWC